jgi:hypothetical protein
MTPITGPTASSSANSAPTLMSGRTASDELYSGDSSDSIQDRYVQFAGIPAATGVFTTTKPGLSAFVTAVHHVDRVAGAGAGGSDRRPPWWLSRPGVCRTDPTYVECRQTRRARRAQGMCDRVGVRSVPCCVAVSTHSQSGGDRSFQRLRCRRLWQARCCRAVALPVLLASGTRRLTDNRMHARATRCRCSRHRRGVRTVER